MSQYLQDQETINLIGDLANYLGLPGPQVPPAPGPSFAGAQHPFYPLQASFIALGSDHQVAVGGMNQRCMLPNTSGSSQPCINITSQSVPSTGIGTNHDPNPRYDVVAGQATLNYSGTTPVLDATFLYVEGGSDSLPTALPIGYTPVALVTVPGSGTGGGSPSGASLQMVLPSLTFVSAQITGTGAAYGAQPVMAAVVTASPFNAPCIAGTAQQNILPTQDAIPAIQQALTFLGPGGAIYVPSASYAVSGTAMTSHAASFAASGPLSLGQAIIFGDDVSFVALADTPVLQLNSGATTLGNARFVDPGVPNGQTSADITLSGAGNSYTVNVSGSSSVFPMNTIVWIVDGDQNSMTATVTTTGTTSYTVESVGELNEGQPQLSPDFGTIATGAQISTPVTSSSYAVKISGALTIDTLFTDHWANGVTITQLQKSEIRSLRCVAISPTGTGVQFTNTDGNGIHDSHIGSIYVESGGGGGSCGVEIDGETGSNSCNSLRFDSIECLSINGAVGPTGSSINAPSGAAAFAGTAVCLHGGQVQGLEFGLIFNSTCANGLYLGGAVQDISVSQLHASGNGPPTGSPTTPDNRIGYALACVGGSGSGKEISNLYIGYLNASSIPNDDKEKALNSANGIYLKHVSNFHVDYALVGNQNFDGVFLDDACRSIGIDHLILLNNGQATGSGTFYGVNAVTGASAPQFVSISKLDASQETAAGVINLGDIQHLSFNDLSSPPSGGLSPAFGYYTSDGSSAAAPGMTIGATGSVNPNALQIGNASTAANASGSSFIGTAGWTLNTVEPHVFGISDNRATSDFHALALDENGNLAIHGNLFFALGGMLTAASGIPTGTSSTGALYVNLAPTGAGGDLLFIYDPHITGWKKLY